MGPKRRAARSSGPQATGKGKKRREEVADEVVEAETAGEAGEASGGGGEKMREETREEGECAGLEAEPPASGGPDGEDEPTPLGLIDLVNEARDQARAGIGARVETASKTVGRKRDLLIKDIFDLGEGEGNCTMCPHEHTIQTWTCSTTVDIEALRGKIKKSWIDLLKQHHWAGCGVSGVWCSRKGNSNMHRHMKTGAHKKSPQCGQAIQELLSKRQNPFNKGRRAMASASSRGSEKRSNGDIHSALTRAMWGKQLTQIDFRKLYVFACAIDTRPFIFGKCRGFSHLFGSILPDKFTVPTRNTCNTILTHMYRDTRKVVREALHDQHAEMGCPFAYLQMDLTSHGGAEYITIDLTYVDASFTRYTVNCGVKRYSKGRADAEKVAEFVQEQIRELHGNRFIDVSELVAYAGVDQGGNVMNAMETLGVATELCAGHRLNSAVMWALGLNGSVDKRHTCKNVAVRRLIGKCAALVGVFSHTLQNADKLKTIQEVLNNFVVSESQKEWYVEWTRSVEDSFEGFEWVSNDEEVDEEIDEGGQSVADGADTGEDIDKGDDQDNDDAVLRVMQDIDEILEGDEFNGKGLEVVRRNDTRWSSTYFMLSRLVELKLAIDLFFLHARQGALANPNASSKKDYSDRNLSVAEWDIVQGLVKLLKPVTTLNTALQGGDGAYSARIAEGVRQLLGYLERQARDPKPEEAEDVTKTREILIEQIKKRFKGVFSVGDYALDDIVFMARYLDPSLSSVEDLQKGRSRAHEVAERFVRFSNNSDIVQMSAPPRTNDTPSDGDDDDDGARVAEEEGEFSVFNSDSAPVDPPYVREIQSYMSDAREFQQTRPKGWWQNFSVLDFWRKMTESTRIMDATGEVQDRYPILSLLARRSFSLLGSSCQAERDFSQLSNLLTPKRRKMDAERTKEMLFVKLNQGFVPLPYTGGRAFQDLPKL